MRTKIDPKRQTDGEVNLIGLYPNIARAYEINRVGGHLVTFCYYEDKEDPERSVNVRDIQVLRAHFEMGGTASGDLLVEVVRPDFDSIQAAIFRAYETKEDIAKRVIEARKFPKPEISAINEVGYSLLKTAYGRLNLSVLEVTIIRRVAATIAQMAFSSVIKVEHIAEAIQYRALLDSDKVKIWTAN